MGWGWGTHLLLVSWVAMTLMFRVFARMASNSCRLNWFVSLICTVTSTVSVKLYSSTDNGHLEVSEGGTVADAM